MGFNNGYESGYEDAKAELTQRIKALEARIAELEAGEGASTPSVPMLKLDGSNVKGEIVWPGGTAQYGGKLATVSSHTEVDGEIKILIIEQSLESGDLIVITEKFPDWTVEFAWDGTNELAGLYDKPAGVYCVGVADSMETQLYLHCIAPLSALVL